MEGMLSPADVAVLSGNAGNRNSDGMFGDNGAWWIVLFLIFGWGRNAAAPFARFPLPSLWSRRAK